MSYLIKTKTATRVEIVAEVATIDAAEAYLNGRFPSVFFERDPDGHDAADAFACIPGTAFGEVFAIERK